MEKLRQQYGSETVLLVAHTIVLIAHPAYCSKAHAAVKINTSEALLHITLLCAQQCVQQRVPFW